MSGKCGGSTSKTHLTQSGPLTDEQFRWGNVKEVRRCCLVHSAANSSQSGVRRKQEACITTTATLLGNDSRCVDSKTKRCSRCIQKTCVSQPLRLLLTPLDSACAKLWPCPAPFNILAQGSMMRQICTSHPPQAPCTPSMHLLHEREDHDSFKKFSPSLFCHCPLAGPHPNRLLGSNACRIAFDTYAVVKHILTEVGVQYLGCTCMLVQCHMSGIATCVHMASSPHRSVLRICIPHRVACLHVAKFVW